MGIHRRWTARAAGGLRRAAGRINGFWHGVRMSWQSEDNFAKIGVILV